MKCVAYDRMSRYADGEAADRERMQIETHLLGCEKCRRLLEACNEENEALQLAAGTPALPDFFTEEIMAKLEPYTPQQEGGLFKLRKGRRIWKRVGYSAAGLLFAVSVGAFVSPSFASYLTNSVFTSGNKGIDKGLQIAGGTGFVQQGEHHVTDKGITFRVIDMMADPTRVAVSYELSKKDGEHVDPVLEIGGYDSHEESKAYITDEKGKLLANLSGWGRNDPYGVIDFDIEREMPAKAVIHLEVDKIGGYKGFGGTEGKWHMDIPVDMKKSLSATSVMSINKQYTAPEGITVALERLSFAPSASQIELTTSLTDGERKKLKQEIEQHKDVINNGNEEALYGGHNLAYHIVDENGKVVAGKGGEVYSPPAETEKNAIMSRSTVDKKGTIKWKDLFVPMGKAKQLTFVLDAVEKEKFTDFSLSFTPDKLAGNPVTKKFEGNTITFKSFQMKKDWQLKREAPFIDAQKIGVVEVEGIQNKTTGTFYHWIARDEGGKVYEVSMSGGTDDPDKEGNARFKQTLQILGLDHEPKQLTLSLTRVMKKYTDVNWKVTFPVK
ncbi:DUF4179 domain-containing protein [Aneurinibacillus tyrosinisolvens]|uniref:DUF4179 domain-containing protein n=1 Tax=Aneurinibacillus tyrosinisolvens TaxID=1443435 RepID=UPI00063F4300|nr:DUF4179 domain-containing protein [Aneurinibacillus tyrosinisolvens]